MMHEGNSFFILWFSQTSRTVVSKVRRSSLIIQSMTCEGREISHDPLTPSPPSVICASRSLRSSVNHWHSTNVVFSAPFELRPCIWGAWLALLMGLGVSRERFFYVAQGGEHTSSSHRKQVIREKGCYCTSNNLAI